MAPSAALLEISPYQADGGELIGKHPRDVRSDFLSLKFRAQKPLNAIREKCIDCCCGNAAEVRKCVAVDCALWPYRMSTNPFRKKRTLSAKQKREMAERLSFASVAASGGQSLIVIGKMLGHSQPATTARYAHLADDPVKAASDAVGRHIAAAMGGGRSGEVVDLPKSRRAALKPNV
jgi:hypothetical protein